MWDSDASTVPRYAKSGNVDLYASAARELTEKVNLIYVPNRGMSR